MKVNHVLKVIKFEEKPCTDAYLCGHLAYERLTLLQLKEITIWKILVFFAWLSSEKELLVFGGHSESTNYSSRIDSQRQCICLFMCASGHICQYFI